MYNYQEERIVCCKECAADFEVNRIGQAFCSQRCRNRFNNRKNKLSKEGTVAIDKILHRNRQLLSERVGQEITVNDLKAAGFNFTYFTSIVKREDVIYHFCYEYVYTFISSNDVRIFKPSINN